MGAALSATSCPRCFVLMAEGTSSDATVLVCGDCGGVWLDNPASVRVFQLLDTTTIDVARQADMDTAKACVDDAPPLACPVCSAPMTRTESRDAPVLVDTCAADGTWLDRGELVRIAEAVAARRGQQLPLAPAPEAPPPPSTVGAGSIAADIGGSVVAEIGAGVAGGVIDGVLTLLASLLG